MPIRITHPELIEVFLMVFGRFARTHNQKTVNALYCSKDFLAGFFFTKLSKTVGDHSVVFDAFCFLHMAINERNSERDGNDDDSDQFPEP